MRYLFIPIVVVTLFTACSKKTESASGTSTASTVSNSVPTAAGFGAWGSTKAEIMGELKKVKAKIISDSANLVVAEVGPAGLTSSDGKPVTTALRMEYHFKNGKLAEMKTGL
jgi:hypothetical protein